jgi:ubiquinone/menaquinone biosynthesis C-methylase UbiE
MAHPRPPRSPRRRRFSRSATPSVLELVRLSPDPVFPPGGEALYRQIALQTELERGQVVLDAACGRGVTTEFIASTYGVETHGLDPDPALVEEADRRTRTAPFADLVSFQDGDLDDIPYQDGVFDLAIGEVGLAATVDPRKAIRELARVVRPMGSVALVQLIWTGDIDEARREILVDYLGARPMLLVEWKQLLREAGVVDLHVEDWSDNASPFRPSMKGPFHDFAEIFSLREKVTILHRALQQWGWRGVKGAIVREQEVHRLLTRQRVLGLSLIWGTKWNQ